MALSASFACLAEPKTINSSAALRYAASMFMADDWPHWCLAIPQKVPPASRNADAPDSALHQPMATAAHSFSDQITPKDVAGTPRFALYPVRMYLGLHTALWSQL